MPVLFSLKMVSLPVFQESMQNQLEVRFVFVLDVSVNGRKVSIDTFEGELGQSHHFFALMDRVCFFLHKASVACS